MAKKSKKKKATARKVVRKSAAKKRVEPIPSNYPVLCPVAILSRGAEAIEWYKRVFGAKERMRMAMPDGKLAHSELAFGKSVLMISDEVPGMFPVTNVSLAMYVKNCDETYRAALDAGATSQQEPKDQFYGDRNARIVDPFGNIWGLMTHIEDVSDAEMYRRSAEMQAQMAQAAAGQRQGQPAA